MEKTEAYLLGTYYEHPILFFAEAVALTRQEPGVSIARIAQCFKKQFDEAEMEALVRELGKPMHGPESSCPIDECPHCDIESKKYD